MEKIHQFSTNRNSRCALFQGIYMQCQIIQYSTSRISLHQFLVQLYSIFLQQTLHYIDKKGKELNFISKSAIASNEHLLFTMARWLGKISIHLQMQHTHRFTKILQLHASQNEVVTACNILSPNNIVPIATLNG
jgi:hypothetical protein